MVISCLCTEIRNVNTVRNWAVHSGVLFKMTWKNTLLNSENVVMHLESKFTMSLVFVTTFVFFFFFLFFFLGGGVLCHLVVQTDFEFKISGPLVCICDTEFPDLWLSALITRNHVFQMGRGYHLHVM